MIAVSTVGSMVRNGEIATIGIERHCGTMAYADDKVNIMHENVVDEITAKLELGDRFEE